MKRLVIPVCILLGLLGLSIFSSRALSNLTEHCVTQLHLAQEMAQQEDWEQARTITHDTFQPWQSHGFVLHALLRHAETDDILLSFRCVEQYLDLEEMDQYAAANITLITQLELLAEMEQATPENIF